MKCRTLASAVVAGLLLLSTTAFSQILVITNLAPKLLIGAESKATYIDLRTNMSRALHIYRNADDVPVLLDFHRIVDDLKAVGSLVHMWQHDTVSGDTAIAEPLKDYFLTLAGLMGQSDRPPFTPTDISNSLRPWTNVWQSPYTGTFTTNNLFNAGYTNLVRLWRLHTTYVTVAGDDLYLLAYPVSMYEEGRSKQNALVQRFGTWFIPPITTNTGFTGPYTNVATEPVWLLDRPTWIKTKLMNSWSQAFP